MLAKHMDEICNELEKLKEPELVEQVKYLDDAQLEELNIRENDHYRGDNNNKGNDDNDEKDHQLSEHFMHKQ